jgi:hypothetical protein
MSTTMLPRDAIALQDEKAGLHRARLFPQDLFASFLPSRQLINLIRYRIQFRRRMLPP